MKSITTNAFLTEAPRQSERLSQIGLGAMEGRVEAGDLRYLRRGFHDRADGGEVEQLMQRRERREWARSAASASPAVAVRRMEIGVADAAAEP